MNVTKAIQRIRPFASLMTVFGLCLAAVVSFGVNQGLALLANKYTVVSTEMCTVAPEMYLSEGYLQASINCATNQYHVVTSDKQLILIANLSPSERQTMTLSCRLYESGKANCDFP
jgi:hypothetical protein